MKNLKLKIRKPFSSRRQERLGDSIFHFPFSILNYREGQSTLEIIIAIMILATGITAAILALFGGQSLSLDSQEANAALRIAHEEVGKIESQALYDFAGIASSSSTEAEFTKEITVLSVSTSTKRVTVRVSWRTNPLRLQDLELVTLVTDWKSVQDTGGDTGGGSPSGDWKNPTTFGSVDLGPGESATDLDVINKIVYMTATASDNKKADFFIVDARNGASPAVTSSIDTGPGLNAIDAISGYAFVANNSSTAQLQVIDTSNLNSPTLVASFTLPGVSGAGAIGNTIFYANNKVYMGTENATGPEFHIIDVSNQTNPVSLGSREMNMEVNAIYVRNNLAYVAVRDDPRLRIYDVSDPSNITQVGSFTAGGQWPVSLWLASSTAYLGTEQGAQREVFIINVSSSSSPTSTGSFNVSDNVNDIRVNGNLAFLATADSNAEFQTWDIANPASTSLWSSFNFPQVGSGVDYENNLVYVAVRSNDALRIITSQ